jgi:serine protease Do
MRIQKLGSARRALAGSAVLGMLFAAAPAVQGRQTARPAPLDELSGSLFGGGPEIGVTVRDVTSDDGAGAGEQGAVVDRVRGDGPAARAGLQAGDIVVTYDGETVRSARQLARLIEETPQDRPVPVAVVRSGKRVELSVTPRARTGWNGATGGDAMRVPLPDLNMRTIPRGRAVMPGLYLPNSSGRLGLEVQNLTGQLGDFFGTSNGVLVTAIASDTPARAAGLRAGDVITEVDGQPVDDTAALRQRLAGKTGLVALTIVRNKVEQTVRVDLDHASARPAAPRRYDR